MLLTRAAGGIGTAEEGSHPGVGGEIRLAGGLVRPAGVLFAHLPAKFVGDPQRFERAEARQPFRPVCVLAPADLHPVAGHIGSDRAGHHMRIVARIE